jgi:hypothetical protein
MTWATWRILIGVARWTCVVLVSAACITLKLSVTACLVGSAMAVDLCLDLACLFSCRGAKFFHKHRRQTWSCLVVTTVGLAVLTTIRRLAGNHAGCVCVCVQPYECPPCAEVFLFLDSVACILTSASGCLRQLLKLTGLSFTTLARSYHCVSCGTGPGGARCTRACRPPLHAAARRPAASRRQWFCRLSVGRRASHRYLGSVLRPGPGWGVMFCFRHILSCVCERSESKNFKNSASAVDHRSWNGPAVG